MEDAAVNKGLLPVLWEMFPNHPNLLPAYFERYTIPGDFVQKPLLSREGANVAIYRGGEVIREGGTYGDEGYVYQAYADVPKFGDSYTTIGSWIVGDQAAGIGIREDATPITCNTSHFVPPLLHMTRRRARRAATEADDDHPLAIDRRATEFPALLRAGARPYGSVRGDLRSRDALSQDSD